MALGQHKGKALTAQTILQQLCVLLYAAIKTDQCGRYYEGHHHTEHWKNNSLTFSKHSKVMTQTSIHKDDKNTTGLLLTSMGHMFHLFKKKQVEF